MGYDLDRFHEKISSSMICSLCRGVMEKPTTEPTCKQKFCQACLVAFWSVSGRCPCGKRISIRKTYDAGPDLCIRISNLHINCDYADSGCNVIIKVRDLKSHVAQCPYKPEFECEAGCVLEESDTEEQRHNCIEVQNEALKEVQNSISELAEMESTIEDNLNKSDALIELMNINNPSINDILNSMYIYKLFKSIYKKLKSFGRLKIFLILLWFFGIFLIYTMI
ncbi:E3 ubiquitin-protein ligase NRDP1-like [Teleopsis dalmanni]|uniref:E3 ubiquitin-protein ligase NRDP1-like n=1 Tax=Teleopsis dalmanni TaxID=139649 RepID=UPI0018CF6C5C|nr:E3 ubiquitin-protein ligase NRDP1-like [Teleopsis dalmanni]